MGFANVTPVLEALNELLLVLLLLLLWHILGTSYRNRPSRSSDMTRLGVPTIMTTCWTQRMFRARKYVEECVREMAMVGARLVV